MSRYRFDLADELDDAALRAFLRQSVMPGRVHLTFLREPNYFDSSADFGSFHQTMVCRDDDRGEIVGLGRRSVGDVHVDGRPTPVGYLSMLRSAERVRSGLLLSRAYRYLRELHTDGRAPYYLTTIAEGNEHALTVLTSGRGGLPSYHPAGRYSTFAIATRVGRTSPEVETSSEAEPIVSFLAAHAKTRQFFPVHESLERPGMAPGDVWQHRDGAGRVDGVMGLWDQRSFRQTVVVGYDGGLGRLRVPLNLAARVTRTPTLPPPGTCLRFGYVAFPAIEQDAPQTFDALLGAVLRRGHERGLDFVLFGCHETDPLWEHARARSFLRYETFVYLVGWGDPPDIDRSRPIHLELGCL